MNGKKTLDTNNFVDSDPEEITPTYRSTMKGCLGPEVPLLDPPLSLLEVPLLDPPLHLLEDPLLHTSLSHVSINY